jgi:hypothetical protein
VRKHPWRDFNGPGKPITQKQMEELLKGLGIEPDADGNYHRKDFEAELEKEMESK